MEQKYASPESDMILDIPSTEPLLEQHHPRGRKQRPDRTKDGLLAALVAAFFFSCITNLALLRSHFREATISLFPEYFYSPVQHLLTFHPRLFTAGLGDASSSYQGPPSASKQAAWNALYSSKLKVPRSSAVKLRNKTIPVPCSSDSNSDGDDFVIGLMVFHNLHCLHFISEALDVLHYPTQYGLNASFNPFDGVHTTPDFAKQEFLPNSFLDVLHTEHCIDLLRQALMCNADITPYVFQEVEKGSGLIGTSVSTVHMCADFTALRDWAGEHIFVGELMGANVSRSVGECSPEDNGCGEEFGEPEWRAENTWMDSGKWIEIDLGTERNTL